MRRHPMSECDYLFLHILLIGNKGTGRTTLRNNYMDDHFLYDTKFILGADFYSKNVALKNGKKVKLLFSDIADEG
jgi:GTPase SAR1 family protein